MSAHLCITTYRSPNNEVIKLELCFVGQDCHRIPSILGSTYGLQTKRLDLSYNAIRTLDGLDKFPFLEELILDNNFIDDSAVFPKLQYLHTLSLNKNKICNLEALMSMMSKQVPNLRFLSLIGNEACPDQLSSMDKDENDYRLYRLYVLHHFPGLNFLDSSAVRRSELREALRRGGLMRLIRPPEHITVNGNIPKIKNGTKPIADSTNNNNGFFQRATSPESCKSHDTSQDDLTFANGKLSSNGSAKKTLTHKTTNINKSKRCMYGTRKFKYLGTNSEGNRFITNQDL
ncbi:unnamed protein product [Meganyctiphanes norvegica]|uniref:Leucine-rich melanocyte differentiation-associated protein n=1 Tax=Meganyctiphanes norvegica TaxID=48144 RepID=A0AAV2R3H0_MEGNR